MKGWCFLVDMEVFPPNFAQNWMELGPKEAWASLPRFLEKIFGRDH